MDFIFIIVVKNISNVIIIVLLFVVGLYDLLWVIVLCWIIGGIIVFVGKLIKVNKLVFLVFC